MLQYIKIEAIVVNFQVKTLQTTHDVADAESGSPRQANARPNHIYP